MKKIVLSTFLASILIISNAYAVSKNAVITRENENVVITATLGKNSNVGITAYKSDYNLSSLADYSGNLDDFYMVKQAKTDSEGRITETIPVSRIPDEGMTVSFSSLDSERVEAELKFYNLTVSGNGNGSVTTDASDKLLKGETVTLTYTPKEGYRLLNLKINGTTVVSNTNTPGIYTTAPVTSDMMVTYSFVSVDNILIDDILSTSNYSENEIGCYLSNEDKAKLNKKLSVVFAGSAPAQIDKYSRISAGIIISDDVNKLNNSKEECTCVEAGSFSSNGKFMIMFVGDNELYSKDFYAKSYAEYKNSETGDIITVFSNTESFKLSPFTKKLYMTTILESLHLNPEGIKPHRLD